MPSRCVVLCFSRAAEQGHPDGQGTDDGAVSTAGPGCRMLDAGCWALLLDGLSW